MTKEHIDFHPNTLDMEIFGVRNGVETRALLQQATEALAKEREAHAETNRMMTEALMQAEAAQGVPDGWRMVPVEPTPKMVAATWYDQVDVRGIIESHNTRNRRIYCAMIEAAPQPERKPMTEVELMNGYCKSKQFQQFVQAFFAGARFAEAFHGIKK